MEVKRYRKILKSIYEIFKKLMKKLSIGFKTFWHQNKLSYFHIPQTYEVLPFTSYT